jgi:hypothetical protein
MEAVLLMSNEAFTPMTIPSIENSTNLSAQPSKSRGRPPGSRNRPRVPEGGINPPQKINIPNSARNTSSSDSESQKKELQLEKEKTAEKISSYIRNDINDKLFMALIGMSNGHIKAEHLFKEGKIPAKAVTNPAYTEMGNAISIPPDVADSWGKLLAELSTTSVGKTLIKSGGSSNLNLIVTAGAVLISSYRYAMTLKPYIELINATKNINGENNESKVVPPTI